jgi:hypothetical protein
MDNVTHIVASAPAQSFHVFSWVSISLISMSFILPCFFLDNFVQVFICFFWSWVSTFVFIFIIDKYTVFYCSTETIDFRGYSLPPGVFSIVPSGLNVTCCMHPEYFVDVIIHIFRELILITLLHQVSGEELSSYSPMAIPCHHHLCLNVSHRCCWPLPCALFISNFCTYFFNQSMANCSIHLRRSLVNYVHGKIILTRWQTLILGSMFGGYFQETLSQTYPEVLSNLLHSMVISVAVRLLLSCACIWSPLTID